MHPKYAQLAVPSNFWFSVPVQAVSLGTNKVLHLFCEILILCHFVFCDVWGLHTQGLLTPHIQRSLWNEPVSVIAEQNTAKLHFVLN